MGVILGILADKFHRVRMLAGCTLVFSIAVILSGSVKEYWQLVILRMLAAAGEAGCNPLATGLLSDIFPEEKRALVMSVFNWGIYGGYGIAFPVGRYIPPLNIWGLEWRITYYGAGVIALIVAFLTWFTLKEPARQAVGEDANSANDPNAKKVTIWTIVCDPRVIMLCLAAAIRHCGEFIVAQLVLLALKDCQFLFDTCCTVGNANCQIIITSNSNCHFPGGMCFAYNCDLYYQIYFPEYDLGWWLFAVTIIIGSIGVVVGGIVSDKFVAKMGIRSRVMVLAVSQIIATPGAFGSVYFNPTWAMIFLGVSYFFGNLRKN